MEIKRINEINFLLKKLSIRYTLLDIEIFDEDKISLYIL